MIACPRGNVEGLVTLTAISTLQNNLWVAVYFCFDPKLLWSLNAVLILMQPSICCMTPTHAVFGLIRTSLNTRIMNLIEEYIKAVL
jgi:hypothetical protein